MSTSNGEQGTVISKWPHHLSIHTPVQANHNVEGSTQSNEAAFSTYPQELMRQLGYSSTGIQLTSSPPDVVTSAFGTTSPIAFNNNNTTKLDISVQDNEIVEQPDNAQLTPVKNEIINGWEVVGQDRPHSAADFTPKTNNNLSTNITAHHPLLSPVSFQPSRLSWLAESKPSLIGIAQPKPLKPEEHQTSESIVEQSSTEVPESSNIGGRPLNEEETARLLLTLSRNFVNTSTSETIQNPIEINVSNVGSSDLMGSPQRSNINNQRSRTFFRPPGHRNNSNTAPADSNGLICEICGFGCASRFHYNSHMNTHGCHQCSICNYRSRTEGRLKKHMQDSHTAEQRREMANNQGEPSEQINVEQPIEVDNQIQRLPATLEQIRALADNNMGFNPESMPTPGTSSGETSQAVKRSGGKPKKYSCKQCGQVLNTKEERWAHSKSHIPIEKQLSCTECDFVTEYKHHLQYHMRNHFGSKPFKCSKCEYTCVNKSMLNSHMKSHTPVYQFRCQDCTYQTKYCHSLKMHTYKYNHRRVQGQVYTVGDENGDECMDGVETESMKNYDIPADDVEALERHRQRERERAQQQNEMNQYQERQPKADVASTSAQLALINQQNITAPRLSSLLLQPINHTGNSQLQHFLLQQQRIGQVQQLIHNVSNGFLPRHKCDICDFTCGTQEELLTHKINHFMFNQQQAQTNALNLYNQRLANNTIPIQQPSTFLDLAAQLRNHPLQQSQQASNLHANHQIAINKAAELTLASHEVKSDNRAHSDTPDPSAATTTTTASTPRVNGETYTEEHMSGSSELNDEAGETSSSPSDSHKSIDAASSSPHSASSVPRDGSSKRKARKLDEISQRLQKSSPDHGEDNMNVEEKIETSTTNGSSTLAQPIPPMTSINGICPDTSHHLNSLISHFSNNGQDRRSHIMPYECKHCRIAFSDPALYQIHLGYHGYESPFKCNRCGHNANSALNFNLHLYQEKH